MDQATPQPAVVDPQRQAVMDQERRRLQGYLTAARAAQADPGMASLRQLLAYRLEEAKSTLLQCLPDEFPAAQARARVYAKLLRDVWDQTP